MPSFGVALAWIILSPIAFFTNLVGVAFILHYNPLFHSVDVALISLLVTMSLNAWLLLPIPAVMELGGFDWSEGLCTFYAWLSMTLRSAHLLVLLIFNVYWMASLRVSDRGQMFSTSKSVKICVFISWFAAIVVGLVPVTGGTSLFNFYSSNVCRFLPYNVDIGLAVFFIVLAFVSMVLGIVSSSDTLVLFHHMKHVALSKYNAGRFHAPRPSAVAQSGSNIHAKYNELAVSMELCLLGLCFTVASCLLNAIPLIVTQFLQLLQDFDQDKLEMTSLWLLLVEALTLPHFL
ncbi:probable G-protein coupled receptor 153, partial [Aplysia californica]|uniref:Probable G-protein coupled receptor 153 n=1 Tax=Aplysia californica TaxID=6500 RepID=A0ABM1A6P7_APLCA